MKFDKDKRYTCNGFPYVNLLTDVGECKEKLLGYYIDERGVKEVVFHLSNLKAAGMATGIGYLDLKESTKYGHIKTDDKVMVRDANNEDWIPMYFSHEYGNTGRAFCFNSGATSWSSGNKCKCEWKQCLTLAEYEKMMQEKNNVF